MDFYPRSPRGERPVTSRACAGCGAISIHAPREGSDALRFGALFCHKAISIHAPREGSDEHLPVEIKQKFDFYPRSPRGERRVFWFQDAGFRAFLSTLPARGATKNSTRGKQPHYYFYPRSPRGERRLICRLSAPPLDFYPRSPRGERQNSTRGKQPHYYFYPRSPRGERRAG